MNKPTLLILSFSDIVNDARVRKQVELFSERYTVTTCGYGEAPSGVAEHLELPVTRSLLWSYVNGVLLRCRLYRVDGRLQPPVRAAQKALRGRSFDAVLANDIDTLGLAVRLFGGDRVHSDLHEFFPGLRDDEPVWVRVRKPHLEWTLRTYGRRAGSMTTVSDTIAERYLADYGLEMGVVRNAAPFAELQPQPVSRPLKLVHSGGAFSERKIEVMMEAAARTTTDLTLDLFLTQQDSPYGKQLQALADELGERVNVFPPVPQHELVGLLNAYDVGIHVLPATNTNNALALPNKFFDFVQARIGILIGPTVDMTKLLRHYGIGAVARDFDRDSVVEALDALDPSTVAKWKAHAGEAARECSAEAQAHVWEEAVASRMRASRS